MLRLPIREANLITFSQEPNTSNITNSTNTFYLVWPIFSQIINWVVLIHDFCRWQITKHLGLFLDKEKWNLNKPLSSLRSISKFFLFKHEIKSQTTKLIRVLLLDKKGKYLGRCIAKWLIFGNFFTPYKSIQDFLKWFKWTWLLFFKILLF